MALQSVIDVNVDFYKKEHILINAKQYDDSSRFISVTCYNNGEIFPINSSEHSAYVRYKKSDNYSIFNICEINRKGNITIELTEQMLASEGICKADLVITKKGSAKVDSNTGEITVNNAAILSTMVFYIDVSSTAVENSEIESTYEFNVLNETVKRYEANYKDVVTTSKSWAVGGTGTRDGEDENNAKYYAELAIKQSFGVDSIVTGIKFPNDSDYRTGKVDLTSCIATVSEIKSYLGI